MTNPTPQTPPDSIEKIADKLTTLSTEIHVSGSNGWARQIREIAQQLRALPTSQRINGEQFTNSERGMLRNVANTLMRRAQKNGQTHQLADVLIGLSNTVPSLPSLAELERDAGRWNYALRHPECLKQENGDYYGTAWWEGLVDAARAKEAKPSNKCSWCGGPNPCNCTDEDCAP